MTALQRLREQLERDLANATTRRQERLIGQALCELAERMEFREFADLRAASGSVAVVAIPSDFSLASELTERSAVPPVLPRRRA